MAGLSLPFTVSLEHMKASTHITAKLRYLNIKKRDKFIYC